VDGKIKLVIFDLDETIVVNEISFSEIRKKVLEEIGCKEKPLHLYEFLRDKGEEYVKLLEKYEVWRAKHAKVVSSLPHIIEFLKERGIKVAVLTRNSKKAALLALGKYVSLFDDIITRDDGFEPKPSADPIIHLLKKYGARCENCIVVGDYEYDIIAGKNAGCITVRVGEGSGDYRISKIDELLNLLNELNSL